MNIKIELEKAMKKKGLKIIEPMVLPTLPDSYYDDEEDYIEWDHDYANSSEMAENQFSVF